MFYWVFWLVTPSYVKIASVLLDLIVHMIPSLKSCFKVLDFFFFVRQLLVLISQFVLLISLRLPRHPLFVAYILQLYPAFLYACQIQICFHSRQEDRSSIFHVLVGNILVPQTLLRHTVLAHALRFVFCFVPFCPITKMQASSFSSLGNDMIPLFNVSVWVESVMTDTNLCGLYRNGKRREDINCSEKHPYVCQHSGPNQRSDLEQSVSGAVKEEFTKIVENIILAVIANHLL